MSEHATNLRRTRADMIGTDDEEHYWECHRAADYIEALEEDVIGGDACATSLHKENKRLRAEDKRIRPLWSAAEDRNFELSTTLRQIAANTCCETCQEAALVAKAALEVMT